MHSAAVVATWTVLVPLLTGLLFELVLVVPIKVPLHQTPYVAVWHNWCLGFIFIHTWLHCRTCRAGAVPCLRPAHARGAVLIGLFGDLPLGRKCRQIVRDGVSGFRPGHAWRVLVLPVVSTLVAYLAAPLLIARGVLPLAGAPWWLQEAAFRAGFPLALAAHGAWAAGSWLLGAVGRVHTEERDRMYLVGRRVLDLRA